MATQSGVFVLQNDETLVPMQPTQFADELNFQNLLAKFPALLVGDQIDPDNPRRFVLVRQEQQVGHEMDTARWSLDHLFLDQDGIPTLVEVKRQSDTRVRREVVGQILEYAANCRSFWTVEQIKASFEATCTANNTQGDLVLSAVLEPNTSAETFWNNVKTNLQAAKLRMLIVSDQIPSELRRIVEFLNEQMDPAEILALELRQFSGEGFRTIVPMVFGQTQEATNKKVALPGARWTEERLLQRIADIFPEAEAAVAKALVDWMKRTGVPLAYGTGRENGSVYLLLRPQGIAINPAYLTTEGRIWFQLKSLNGKPVFGDPASRRALLDRFATVANSGLSNADVNGYPSLTLAAIAADPQGQQKVIAAFDWMLQKVEGKL